MQRRIIEIDQAKCTGCSLCLKLCPDGGLGMVDGKVTLLRPEQCDGMGGCMPVCPVDAIHFVECEAAAYDSEAVRQMRKSIAMEYSRPYSGCLGSQPKALIRSETDTAWQSELAQWPVQMKLVPTIASYFDGAELLIAADCTAFSCADFHQRFMRGHVTLIGCPKLDSGDYTEKLEEILVRNSIRSLTVVRMEAPCCSRLAQSVAQALKNSMKALPLRVVILSSEGGILAV